MSRGDEVDGRIVKHLEEIAEQRESFDRVAARLTEAGFVAAWSREGTADQTDQKGSLERAYEQLINDLHGLLELIEVEASRAGLIPDAALLKGGDEERRAWWTEAAAADVDVAGANRGESPGRWRRLAFYGHLDHDLATRLVAFSGSRDLFQHAYAQRTASRGLEVWTTMIALRSHLAEIVAAILALRDASTKA